MTSAVQGLSLPITLAVLGAALLHAGWNALLKSSSDKQLDTVAISVGAGLVGLAVAVWLPFPASESWPWLAGSALVHVLYFLFLAGAYRWGDLSYAYPIMRGGGACPHRHRNRARGDDIATRCDRGNHHSAALA